MTSLNDAISAYFSIRMGGLARSTVTAQRNQIMRMQQWMVARLADSDPALVDIDADLVTRYLETLAPPRLTASTYNNYRQYLMLFFEFCRAEGWIETSPCDTREQLECEGRSGSTCGRSRCRR